VNLVAKLLVSGISQNAFLNASSNLVDMKWRAPAVLKSGTNEFERQSLSRLLSSSEGTQSHDVHIHPICFTLSFLN
jgi:hypothetical protein